MKHGPSWASLNKSGAGEVFSCFAEELLVSLTGARAEALEVATQHHKVHKLQVC